MRLEMPQMQMEIFRHQLDFVRLLTDTGKWHLQMAGLQQSEMLKIPDLFCVDNQQAQLLEI
jgi:hypothetical protein